MSKSHYFRQGAHNWLAKESKKYRWEHARKTWRWHRKRITEAARMAGVKPGDVELIGPVIITSKNIIYRRISLPEYKFDPAVSRKLIDDWASDGNQ